MGRAQTPETRAKIAAARRGMKFTEEHKQNMSAAMLGKKMGFVKVKWKEDVSHSALHRWLRYHYPKTHICERCGVYAERTDYAFLHHPQPYTRNRSDYEEMCCKCHCAYDAAKRRAAKGAA